MAQYAVLITWREVRGGEPTLDQLHQALSPFRLHGVLVGLARLTALLKTWQNDIDFESDAILAQRFLPTYSPEIARVRASGPGRLLFTRIGFLFVAKQACRVCDPHGRLIQTPGDVEQILGCCLMANDLLLGRMPAAGDRTEVYKPRSAKSRPVEHLITSEIKSRSLKEGDLRLAHDYLLAYLSDQPNHMGSVLYSFFAGLENYLRQAVPKYSGITAHKDIKDILSELSERRQKDSPPPEQRGGPKQQTKFLSLGELLDVHSFLTPEPKPPAWNELVRVRNEIMHGELIGDHLLNVWERPLLTFLRHSARLAALIEALEKITKDLYPGYY